MRLTSISAQDIPPIQIFAANALSDVVVLAGPNGVGKTKLIEGLLRYFQKPSSGRGIRLTFEATCDSERAQWGKNSLDTSTPEDLPKLTATLQKSRRRGNWESSVLNFDSDRSIQQINPYSFSWDFQDPYQEEVGWSYGFGKLRDRFQDTLHSIFRKVRSRREEIAARVEELFKQHKGAAVSLDSNEFPDPLAPFKHAFSQLLAPKQLLDADPKNQQLFYDFEGKTLPITSLSSGEREVVNIVFDFLLRKPTDSIVIFDEPELHLHPELSYRLLQTLRGAGSNNQFIFCTHSPDIITASLDSSVIFIAPPKAKNGPAANQAITVREEDETHQALKLLGQSIGIISLGRKIVLVEGTQSSLDKQVYGAILRDRFPSLVLVPGGGKGVLTSFAFLHKEVLERTIWGVEFFMLCDRDAVPPSKDGDELEASSGGRLRVLRKYHIENYFLDELVLADVFAGMEPDESWLRHPAKIRAELKEIARGLTSYTTALTASAYFREAVGNVDLMPKACHDKTVEELISLIFARANTESSRVTATLQQSQIESYVRDLAARLEKSLTEDTQEWKDITPGKQLLNMFASKAKLDVGRLKILYLRAAEKRSSSPFQEILEIFENFNSK